MSHEHLHLHLYHHIDDELQSFLKHYFHSLNRNLENIMASLQEVTASLQEARQDLASVNTTLGKIGNETTATLAKATQLEARVAELEAIIASGGNSTPELDAQVQGLKDDIASLKASAQTADDLVPDVPAP